MEFQQIISDIFSGLTGDAKADMKYLHEQGEMYKDHEYATEINRAIGRKIYELLPDGAKNELEQMIDNHQQGIDSVLEEAMFQLKSQHNPEKAEQLFASVIEKTSGMFKEDAECKYLCFENFIEKAIYDLKYNPEKTIRKPTYNYAMIYYMYGYCLLENKKMAEAEQALLTAHRWNPVSSQIMFELAEIYKIAEQYPLFLSWTRKAMECTYSAHDLARAYRNLGYYYIDMKEYTLAADLFYFSMYFEESQMARSELFYIGQLTGEMPKQSDIQAFRSALEAKKIPFGPDGEIISLVYQLGQLFAENQQYDIAAECFENVFRFTNDPQVEQKMKQMQEQRGNNGE